MSSINSGGKAKKSVPISPSQNLLPTSTELERFNKINPTFAERVVTMAEKQAEHRQYIERQDALRHDQALKLSGRDSLLGLLFGMLIVVLALGLAAYMISQHQLTGGVFTIFGVIATIATAFVIGHRAKK
ncbi:hypothetical protein IV73_GL000233 [Weissella kandleri]|uniref:DUF2335 domain-containing protein n=1 Tax=Weissella kandleri TaxID=1616 RepID=A0A0R2JEG1_9LACO|nr:DUF2335 domain-containing protein [Weissella kandleri]KRN75737.1 hypothetical protein IV73_GL000233 [Weissella kandleri]